MQRQFTRTEWAAITAPSREDEQLHMFYQHWCLKESYIKAVGVGLGLEGGLERLSFVADRHMAAPANRQPQFVCGCKASMTLDSIPAPEWHIEQTYLDATHPVAVITGPLAVSRHASYLPPCWVSMGSGRH